MKKRAEREVAAFAYTGVGILKPELFAGDQPEVYRLAPLFFRAAEAGRLFGVRLDGLWMHVGTPEAVEEAERAIERSAR